MTVMVGLLRGHPEVALFAALSLGFFLGKRKVGTFSLGTAAGVLLAGVLIGQLHIPIPELVKSVSFALFIFVVGYRVGPQFFRGLKGEGLRLAGVALMLAVTGYFRCARPSGKRWMIRNCSPSRWRRCTWS
jgi:putative transport protein